MNRIIIINQGQDQLCQILSQQLNYCKVLDDFPASMQKDDGICWLPADNSRVDLAVEKLVNLIDHSHDAPAKIVMKSIVGTADDATDDQLTQWYGTNFQTLVMNHLYTIKMIDELEYPYTIIRTLPLTDEKVDRSVSQESEPFTGARSNVAAVSRVITQAILTDDYRNQSIGI